MRKKITVTAEHIRQSALLANGASYAIEDCCPVALALRANGFPKALVCESSIQLFGTKPATQQPLSKKAREFVRRFGEGLAVESFSFLIRTEMAPDSDPQGFVVDSAPQQNSERNYQP